MNKFSMNGYIWNVQFVEPNDPMLVDRTNNYRVATTDPKNLKVYLSNALYGDFLMKVFLHELGHCALHSYNLTDELHRMVRPEKWIESEEWACNLIAEFGFKIFSTAFSVLGYNAWKYIPYELDRLMVA